MRRSVKRYGWSLVAAVLVVFAVPWFRWGHEQVVGGLPIWLWWHVSWMALVAVVFGLFARRAWGLGIEEAGDG